jgi:hypothetical protein
LIGSHSPPPLVDFSGPSAVRGDDDVGGTGVTCVGVTVDPGVGGDGDLGLGGADEACTGGTDDAGASGSGAALLQGAPSISDGRKPRPYDATGVHAWT